MQGTPDGVSLVSYGKIFTLLFVTFGPLKIISWSIPVSAVLLSGGIIFALVGLNVLLEQYQPAHAPPPLPPEQTMILRALQQMNIIKG